MHTDKPSSTLAAIRRLHQRHRQRQFQQFSRFNLRMLFVFLTAACVVFAVIGIWGAAAWSHLTVRFVEVLTHLPTEPAGPVFAIPLLFSTLALGATLALLAHRLGSRNGYLLVATLAVTALFAFSAAACLDTPPLSSTDVQDVTSEQVLKLALLFVAYVPPLSAFLGWFSLNLPHRPS